MIPIPFKWHKHTYNLVTCPSLPARCAPSCPGYRRRPSLWRAHTPAPAGLVPPLCAEILKVGKQNTQLQQTHTHTLSSGTRVHMYLLSSFRQTIQWLEVHLYLRVTICILHVQQLGTNPFKPLGLLLYLPLKQRHVGVSGRSCCSLQGWRPHLLWGAVATLRRCRQEVSGAVGVHWCTRVPRVRTGVGGERFGFCTFTCGLRVAVVLCAFPSLKDSTHWVCQLSSMKLKFTSIHTGNWLQHFQWNPNLSIKRL